MSQVLHVSSQTFPNEVLHSDLPVVVDFYASWCPPCRMLSPILDRMAAEFAGRIKFVKINSDEEGQLAAQYKVTGLPTVVMIDQGQTVGQFAGLPSEATVRAELHKWVGSQSKTT